MQEWISAFSTKFAAGVIFPLHDALFSGSVRFYWGYFLTGMAIAAFVHYRQRRADPFFARLFDRQVWMSASAVNDYYVLLINSVLRVLVLTWVILNFQVLASWTTSLLRAVGVSGTQTGSDSVLVALALTVSLFFFRDFARFISHYVFHKVPVMWEFHKVHHSAEVLNFFTSERFHPVETLFSSIVMVSITSIVNGVFIAFYGDTLTPLTVAGANAFWVLGNLFGGILRHSPFPISFGPAIERWIISPAQHQIHHSDSPEHFDKNMGGTLAIWDRMAGTLVLTQGQKVTGYGIGEETPVFRSLSEIYMRPFVNVYRMFRGRPVLVPGE